MTGSRVPVYAALVAAVAAVYGASWAHPFHFDDGHSIVGNPNLRALANIPGFFADPGAFSADPKHAMYRPLLLTSLALNYWVSGPAAWSYHAVNIAVHGAVAIAVFEVAVGLLGPGLSAALAAGLFALHPAHSEAVYYISSRSESLAALFVLIAVALHLRALPRWWAAVGEVASLAAGLLVKSTAAALLPILLLADLLLAPGAWRRRWPLHGALWAVAGGYLLVTRDLVARATLEPVRTYAEQLWSQVKGLVYYLHLLSLPRGLSVDHQFQLSSSPADPYAASALAAVASLVAVAALCRRAWPLAPFLGLWFLAALAPASLVPLNVIVNDHRVYLSGVAFATGSAWLATGAAPGAATARLGLLAAVPLLGVLALARGSAWSDAESLWRDAAHKGPAMARPLLMLGQEYADQGRLAEAAAALEGGLRRDPDFEPGYHTLARTCLRQGDLARAQAAAELGLERLPQSASLWGLLAEVLRERAQADPVSGTSWLEGSAAAYSRAIALEPAEADYRDNLGNTYQVLGRPLEALVQHERAVALRPEEPASRLNLGNALLMLERLAEAEAQYLAAVRLDPRYEPAWLSLEALYRRAGDAEAAAAAAARAASARAEATGGDPRVGAGR